MRKRKNVTFDDLEEILMELQKGLENHVESDLAPQHRQAMYSRMTLAFAGAYTKLTKMRGG